jgi:hypothetical protein
MSFLILGGCWCDIARSVHSTNEDTRDDMKDSFHGGSSVRSSTT